MTDIRDTDCPAMADLSGFADDRGDERIAAHIRTCTECARTVDQFRKFDAAIRRNILPPEGLANRISAAVAGARQDQPLAFRPWWQSPALRLAAAFAVTAGALAVLVLALGRDSQDGRQMVVTQPHVQPGQTTVHLDSPDQATLEREVAKVSVMRDAADAGAAVSNRNMLTVAPRVRHVWSVSDVDASSSLLKERLPAGSYSMAVENGNLCFLVTLQDDKLQNLVDDLAARKWELMSDAAPQPNKPSRLDHSTVHYQLVLAGQKD